MESFFLTSKKASVTVVFLVISVLIVSSGVIITNELKKSNEDNAAGTGLVLLDDEQDISQYSDSSGDEIEFAFRDSEGRISSKKSSGGGGGGSSGSESQTYNEPETLDNDEIADNQTSENQTETNYTEEINESVAGVGNESNLSREIKIQGACKPYSIETNEGPGGQYCTYDDYEECYDYMTKSTVIAYDWDLFNGYHEEERGTDYCEGNTLQEAWLNCGLTTITADAVHWKEKDCNDYDSETWVYYCTPTQVRKYKRDYNGYCSNGACKISIQEVDDQFISQKGDNDYCSKRKEGYNNGWQGCSLCGHGDYDCDSNSECSGNLVCIGPWPDPPFGGDWDGCCEAGERWDTTREECCECSSGDGPCCDGCHYRSTNYVCDYHYGNYYYSCMEGDCLGDNVYKRDKRRFCDGSSPTCSGATDWNIATTHETCSSNEFCDGTTTGWAWGEIHCSTAQCTSGPCCDTDCGDYSFLSTSSVCRTVVDFGCLDGEGTSNPGADVYSRTKPQYCPGSSNLCNGAYGSWSSWLPYDYCILDQYCTNGDPTCNECGYHTHWACHGNDVYYYDDCNNLEDIKEECEIGCFNGECVTSPSECYDDAGCGDDGPIGDPYCSNDDVWQNQITYTCNYPGQINAYCSNSTSPSQEDCMEDSYSDNYCYDDDVYQNFTDRGCLDGACFENTTPQFIQECGEEGCSDGECLYVECYNDTMCGPDDDYVGDPFCHDGDVWQDQIAYTCNYPGTGNSYCSDSTAPDLKEPCGTDYCEDWGSNYCKLDDLYHEKMCHDKGCSGGVCFDYTYTEEEKVQECGISEYTGESYCYNNDIYRDYITRGCSNSHCISSTSEKKTEDCAHGCISGRCLVEVCNYGGCYYY